MTMTLPALAQQVDQVRMRSQLRACIVAEAVHCELLQQVEKIEWHLNGAPLIAEIAGLLATPDDREALGVAYTLETIGFPALFTATEIRESALKRAGRDGIAPVFGTTPYMIMWELAQRMQERSRLVRPPFKPSSSPSPVASRFRPVR
ncbi:hypothetical protein ACFSM5_02575 [Lacibacterium aquatile]|uniref:Uncharacterized protein n=1 Tax=Lacibacterium aquatile TaxID=1168082 RepID=A0ABW5DQD8_9PROT